MAVGLTNAYPVALPPTGPVDLAYRAGEEENMKITDLKCAVIGQNPIVRIVTDEGISGYGEIEASKPYVKPQVLFYKHLVIGEDPTNVERVMLRIRRLGAFKPW